MLVYACLICGGDVVECVRAVCVRAEDVRVSAGRYPYYWYSQLRRRPTWCIKTGDRYYSTTELALNTPQYINRAHFHHSLLPVRFFDAVRYRGTASMCIPAAIHCQLATMSKKPTWRDEIKSKLKQRQQENQYSNVGIPPISIIYSPLHDNTAAS